MVVHPLLLHFPVALLAVGTVALIISLLRPGLTHQIAFEGFINGVMALGYAGLVLTVVTGLFDMQASPKTQAREGWIVIAVLHILTGVSLMVVYGSLLYRRFVFLPPTPHPATTTEPEIPTNITQPDLITRTETRRPDWLSLVLAGLGLILLIVAGWLGGTLVYEYRVGIS